MKPDYTVRDSLPEFEDDNAAIAALYLEVSRRSPVHQILYSKKDIIFNKDLLVKDGKLLASTKNLGENGRTKEAELWLYKDVYMYIRVYNGSPNVHVVFVNNEDDDGKSVKSVFEEFEKESKPIEATTENAVKIKFWSLAS